MRSSSRRREDGLLRHALELVSRPAFLVPILLTAALSFGYFLTHYSISLDDLSGYRYSHGELLAQGRFTWTLIAALLGLGENVPFWPDLIGCILLVIDSVFFAVLFRAASHRQVGILPCALFSCLYLSYPLVNEIYSYANLTIFIGGGTLLALTALWFLFRHPGILSFLGAIVLLLFVCSWYESVAVVYVCAVLALLLLQSREHGSPLRRLGSLLLEGVRYALPFIIAFALESVVAKQLMVSLSISPSQFGANKFAWANGEILTTLQELLGNFFFQYGVKGLWYLPITILNLCVVVMLILGVRECAARRSFTPLLLYVGFLLCLVLLSLVQGSASAYRTCQVFPVFVGLTGLLTLDAAAEARRSGVQHICLALALLLLCLQIADLNRWFMIDYARYQEETATACAIGDALQDYDLTKPVLFVGHYTLSDQWYRASYVSSQDFRVAALEAIHLFPAIDTSGDYCLKIQGNYMKSYLDWGVDAFFEVNTELLKFFTLCGYPLVQGSAAQYAEGSALAQSMPGWPDAGSILDTSNFILVKLG